VLFVGTKRQAQETIQGEALRCGMPYVTQRWLGGMLTNWRTIRQRVNELEKLERMRDRGDFERVTKKEALLFSREIERLDTLLGGIRSLARLPELLFVVDVKREETAIHEANLLNIPVIALVDTNCDPTNIDYVIPSNDDAIRAIKLLVGKIADASLEGRGMRKEEEIEPMREGMRAYAEEAELSDEELLGEATLAKLTPKTVIFTDEEELEEESIPGWESESEEDEEIDEEIEEVEDEEEADEDLVEEVEFDEDEAEE
jgi:small subunit ribosomal protein S2